MSAHHFLILAGLALSTLPCLVPMKRPRDVASPADGAPADADARRRQPAVIAYRVDLLPKYDASFYERARVGLKKSFEVEVPPRAARSFEVPRGHFFRIHCVDGPQVGDLNLWCLDNLEERFYTGKTRQLHATHLTKGDRLWSCFPFLRPMATITHDSLQWYGWDQDGASVHDVIGTRCDPYSNRMLRGEDYDHCCHSNLIRALAERGVADAEKHVHDVLNVFMCTGFTKDTHQYFMKASPVRPGDFLEFFAEIDLLGALSACPGGDTSASHSDDTQRCFPLKVEVLEPCSKELEGWIGPQVCGYAGKHGLA
ncbi:unnamed protein product [Durusdinium trenchii]|uniref:DUF1989 domain-containing protein n=1 Tax=Durusdinium trenchii TaxID=1381693 RepID=A0ABP0RX96_9DINO